MEQLCASKRNCEEVGSCSGFSPEVVYEALMKPNWKLLHRFPFRLGLLAGSIYSVGTPGTFRERPLSFSERRSRNGPAAAIHFSGVG